MALECTPAADLAYADLSALLERAFAHYLAPVRGVPPRFEESSSRSSCGSRSLARPDYLDWISIIWAW